MYAGVADGSRSEAARLSAFALVSGQRPVLIRPSSARSAASISPVVKVQCPARWTKAWRSSAERCASSTRDRRAA